ncbi:Metallo-dependent phosphatase-like protein [Melanogaster broomeanus]|nr:Metallo-dependent phosphatase-like protein [Melanogaster broomeanus]
MSRAQTKSHPTEPVHLKAGNGSTVYTDYDPLNPPPHPGPGYTRFVCLSDTHSATFDVPDGDVLLHSGDLTQLGSYDELEVTMEWLEQLTHPVKIIIAGNHDLPLDNDDGWYDNNWHRFSRRRNSDKQVGQDAARIRQLVSEIPGIVYLQDQQHTFRVREGGREWTVYGSPWQPWFYDWAFNYTEDEAQDIVSRIPEVDILLTHGPPHNLLDCAIGDKHVGCPALLSHLSRMQKPPLLHCFGHIHEARGALAHVWESSPIASDESGREQPIQEVSGSEAGLSARDIRETIMVNAANTPLKRSDICGGPGHQPMIVDILDSTQR